MRKFAITCAQLKRLSLLRDPCFPFIEISSITCTTRLPTIHHLHRRPCCRHASDVSCVVLTLNRQCLTSNIRSASIFQIRLLELVNWDSIFSRFVKFTRLND